MTIAFVFEIFLPVVNGIVTSSHNLAQNLIAKGHRVIYIAPRWRESTIHEVDGVPVYYITSYETFVYPGMRNVLPWSRHVKQILEQEQVDIVHSTGPWLLNWAALRAARKLKRATVQTFHTMLQEPTYIRYFTHSDALVPVLRALAWKYFGLYMRRSDAVTGPSEYVARELTEHYPDVPIHHIPNGIDLEKFGQSKPFADTQRQFPMFNEKTFIFIGRLGAEKSVDRLINGMSLAIRQDPEIRLILIGDGPGRRAYEDQVRELRLTASIAFLGRISPSDLYTSGLIHNACANVTASTTESFGMTVVESMAAGTPSIVPDVPGISELTRGTGLTFPRDRLEALATEVLRLTRDDELRRQLSAACLKRSRDFDGAVIADQFEELYTKVLEDHTS
ncbi:MAG: glycosyltransferase [Spirochaeta sp.]|jgi:1,2-diacylglycerol 3-alpha-glucosyltransferase|nr:glycosyltransferase [Spirochaeta sp.]